MSRNREESMRSVLRLIIGLAGVATAVAPVAAQEPVAEVRTWGGETLQLSQPSLEMFYTTLVKGKWRRAAPPDASPSATPSMLFGSPTALSGMLDKKPDPMSGQRQAEVVTLPKGATERGVP